MGITVLGFEGWWQRLHKLLAVGTRVPKWTAYSGYLGDSFEVARVTVSGVEIALPGSWQFVPKKEFEKVYLLWDEYLLGRVRRPVIRDATRFSTYVIAVLRWTEDQGLAD